MTVGLPPDCLWKCKHFNTDQPGMTCKAYPEAIPRDIMDGAKHDTVRDDQVGDYVFTPKEEEK